MPIGGNEAEWLTRKKRIDTRLRAPNPPWRIVHYQDGLDLSTLSCRAVEELPTDNGPADYGFFVNGVFLGILATKGVTVNPQNVLEQTGTIFAGARLPLCCRSINYDCSHLSPK